ncbi:leucine-rich alpha-2-glycoprotein [Peromyscus californicus insignis]|uniref:leucine-rich alpha-2-glycoprotein n=1 Tax=Peromyscus californicus insignis TaxID=564181 RepID=UPI0022A7EE6A|nr:leucine-rich alpha-2-glycoprotein [Peromyscus californicus insignis]
MWVEAPSETLALAEPMVGLLERSPGEGASEVPFPDRSPQDLNSRCLPRILLLLALLVTSAEGIAFSLKECLVLPSAEGSTVSCHRATEFPSPLPADTVHLSVEFSNLTQLPVSALRACPRLRELHLSSNRLQALAPGLLAPVPGLRVLDLTHNELRGLPPGLFLSSAALRTLVLRDNRLQAASARWLWGLRALGHLDLAGNRLRTLPPRLLTGLRALSTLDLGHNLLETLPSDLLRGPRRLQRLHLEGNRLRRLGDGLLAPQPFLRVLFLSDNRLAAVAAGAFRGLRQLDMLDLSNNSLSSTPPGLWASLGRPARDMQDGFDVSHNPWVCDKDLRDLCRWVHANRHKMFSQNDTRCAGPEALRGRLLLDVAELGSL